MSITWTETKGALLSLESKFKCFICDKLPTDPQLLWCKHSFCSSCVEDKPKCPRCQFPISPQEMVPDIMLNKLLQAMRVASILSNSTEEEDCNRKENPTVIFQPKKDLNISNIKFTNSSIPEEKDVTAIDKERRLIKTDEIKMKVSRRSSRSNSRSRGNSPQKVEMDEIKVTPRNGSRNNSKTRGNSPQKVKMDDIKIIAPRRSSRSNSRSRGNSPQKVKMNEIKVDSSRRSSRSSSRSRGNSPQKVKPEISVKNKTKTKSQKVSPKALSKNNHVLSTPKAKQISKSGTPILYSAKKVQNTNKVNSKGETPLQIACRQGKLSLVQQLLRDGAEPNVKDYANWTPLCDAVGSGRVEVVRTLLEAGAGVNTPANLNTTALVEAVVRRNTAMVDLLLSYGADIHQRTTLGNTAMSLADEEMRNVMLNCRHVSAPTAPRVPTAPRAVLVDVQLPPPQHDQVMELGRQFNLTLSTGFTEDITHVVVEKTASNTCEASTNVMLAIMSGCSVVGMDWVKACLKAGQLVAVDEFEPCGTKDHPNSDVFHKARLNKEQLLPRLFDGCHISLQQDQTWPRQLKVDTVSLITAAGAIYQPRQCDPERVPEEETTVMFHTDPAGPLGALSHIILYQAGAPVHEPLLKYNMGHVKSLSLSWFYKCIQTFSVTLD